MIKGAEGSDHGRRGAIDAGSSEQEPDVPRLMRLFPRWHAWLDRAGWHARCRRVPEGTPPRVPAGTHEALEAAIRAVGRRLTRARAPVSLRGTPRGNGKEG